MAESEVEVILREIRERVIAEQREAQVTASQNNGSGKSGESLVEIDTDFDHDLSLINSYLVTTERAWDRLPPVVSDRSGFFARLELWFKRNMKRATRWYAWEQVNFNAAVHHALHDLVILFQRQQTVLQELRARSERSSADLAELVSRLEQLQIDSERQRAADVVDTQTRLREVITELRAFDHELREVDARLREQQQVCFKQLSLESSERTVLEDRSRRKTDAALANLELRIAQLEKDKR
jgi:hypothetical protein